MLFYISILGIFLSFVLLYFNARKYTSTIYLGIFCLILSLYSINQHVILYSKSEFWVSIIFTNFTFLYYLIGPVCYFYIRSVLTNDFHLKKRDLWHFLPTLIYLSASLPYILSSYSYKVNIAKSIVSNSAFLGHFHATILSDLFSNTVVYLSRPVLAFLYICWSIRLILRFSTKKDKALILSKHPFMKSWLSFFLGFQLLLVSSHLFIIYKVFQSDRSELLSTSNLLQALSFIGLIGLYLTPFFFPQVLYGIFNLNRQADEDDKSTPLTQELNKNVSKFEFDYTLTIIQKITTCMQEEQPYLQPDFNLTQFSALIQVPVHHLVFFFREIKRQSFTDYRNECRVHYAKMLIEAGKADELTLEAIGLQSGFVTRNTFFTAFKKVEGISPGAFAAKIHN